MRKLSVGVVVVGGVALAVILHEQLIVDEKTLGPAAVVAVAIAGTILVLVLATFMLHGTRYGNAAGKAWLAAASTILSFLVLDFLAGLFLIQPLSPALVQDQYRHHRLVPNSFSRIAARDFSYVQRVNNFGIRGRDVQAENPQKRFRILMLGDSFTMGKGVEDDQTFSVLLERALNRRTTACGGRSIEVLNGGVDSYAPILSLMELKRDLRPLNPHLVVLNLDVSDLVQETAYRRHAVFGADGEIVAVPALREQEVPLTERIGTWTERHLFFTRALLFYIDRLSDEKDADLRTVLSQADFEIVAHTLAQDAEPREAQWKNIFDSVTRVRDLVRANGGEFLLCVYPWAHEISRTEWVPGRYTFIPANAVPSDKSLNTIRDFAARNDIQFLDLFPVFRAHLWEGPLYYQHDMHWTPAGHKVMAAGLEHYLASRYAERWCP